MEQVIVNMALGAWDSVVRPLNKTFSAISDAEMYEEIAPDRNRSVYILGHLTAVNDWMLPTLAFGERLYPEMEEQFLSKPDRSVEALPEIAVLRRRWTEVNDLVRSKLVDMSPGRWLEAHATVSAEDFAANPQRNRLSVVNNRVGHMWFHLGQLALLRKQRPS